MKSIHQFLVIVMLTAVAASCAESHATHKNEMARIAIHAVEGAGLSTVAVSLDAISFNTDTCRLGLFDMNDPVTEIPSQLEPGVTPRLWFVFDNNAGDKTYILKSLAKESPTESVATIEKDEATTSLLLNNAPVLAYHHAEVLPPEGTDPRFRRSAFIHPLKSPGGAVLTRIQPPDHYHHYGIWNPWTNTTIEGVGDVDFWNLSKGEGRVRYGGYLGTEQGPVYGAIKVRQEHIAYIEQDEQNELLALNETWDIRVWDTGQKNVFIVDLTTTLNSPLPAGILFNAYRYGGGIGYRATENWTKENATVLTSEGKTRNETDASEARWCIIEGETDVADGRSGIIFLSHPANRMHPEPMRMWDENAVDDKGEIFFEFTPIRHQPWQIEPNKSYTLKYRMIVYDGHITAEEAEECWRAFARAPIIHIQ